MQSINNYLKLSYSPLTLYEFDMFKGRDEYIEKQLQLTTIYMIVKRPLPIMKLISADPSHFHISVSLDETNTSCEIIMVTGDNNNLFPKGMHSIQRFSNLNDRNPDERFHAITLNRENGTNDGEFVLHANFDRLIHLAFNKCINIRIKGDITPFITYEVLYVGQCVNEHIYQRFKAHHALQNILIQEEIIPPDYDKANDLLILPFHIESDVYSCLCGTSNDTDIDQFTDAILGNIPYSSEVISRDCEKALIHAIDPKYNIKKFKQYPKSSDGLFKYNLSSCIYTISEKLILSYSSDKKIYGDYNDNSTLISIINNNDFEIINFIMQTSQTSN